MMIFEKQISKEDASRMTPLVKYDNILHLRKNMPKTLNLKDCMLLFSLITERTQLKYSYINIYPHIYRLHSFLSCT